MKRITLQTAAYRYLEQSFKEWLDILGYAPSTVRQFPACVREYLYYLETQHITQIHKIDIPNIKDYYRQLSQRKNKRRGGGLSNKYLNVHLSALEKMLEYLRTQARILLPPTGIKQEPAETQPITPLSTDQIKHLYATVQANENEYLKTLDNAILAIYYDCGLRRNEGVALNLSDVDFDRRLIHVRKGKGSKPRLVPFSKTTSQHLQAYRYDARPLVAQKDDAFLLNQKGNRANGDWLNKRLKELQAQSEDATISQLSLHLHLLRHSIATHLLYEGMELEKVAQFLGHRSLSSTQVYTHLVNRSFSNSQPI